MDCIAVWFLGTVNNGNLFHYHYMEKARKHGEIKGRFTNTPTTVKYELGSSHTLRRVCTWFVGKSVQSLRKNLKDPTGPATETQTLLEHSCQVSKRNPKKASLRAILRSQGQERLPQKFKESE